MNLLLYDRINFKLKDNLTNNKNSKDSVIIFDYTCASLFFPTYSTQFTN